MVMVMAMVSRNLAGSRLPYSTDEPGDGLDDPRAVALDDPDEHHGQLVVWHCLDRK